MQYPNSPWIREIPTEDYSILFATAFRLNEGINLTDYAKRLPEGIVLCDSKMVASTQHIESILLQTIESWKRNIRLVRNGSIEILMRVTCRGQISEAVRLSGIENIKEVALFGLTRSINRVREVIRNFSLSFENAIEDPSLLDLTSSKSKRLKELHGLPKTLKIEDLQTALQERSVLLVFSK